MSVYVFPLYILVHSFVSYAEKVEGTRFAPTNLGLALVTGYQSLAIPLGKPYLRAAMEADCKLIAAGAKSKQAVVAECLAQVRPCSLFTCRRLTLISVPADACGV